MPKTSPSILRTAHGRAAQLGALLVAECPPMDEIPPLNGSDSVKGAAVRGPRVGRTGAGTFAPGNQAAANRGPSLSQIRCDPNATEEVRRIKRRAASLKARRERELSVSYGGLPVSVAVKTELVSWASNNAWADHFETQGDIVKASTLREKASGHQLKAIAIADREAKARKEATGPGDPLGLDA